jgi:membrane-bound lytic murein transglycosylase B
MRIFILVLLFLNPANLYSAKNPYDNVEVENFITFMKEKHNYNEKKLRSLFEQITPESRLTKFFKKAPERTLTWNGCSKKDIRCTNYKNLFVNKSLANGGSKYWKENEKYLKQAFYRFGVPSEIIVAIIGIESKFGKKTGSFKTFDTLASLSVGPNKGRRAKFYKTELINFLLMCSENNLNPSLIKGSYAGALGKPQFISSSYRNFAIDFDNDGVTDLWNSNADVIGSVANYLKRNGWLQDKLILSDIVFSESTKSTLHNQSKKSYKPKTPYYKFKDKKITSVASISNDELLSVIRMKESKGNFYQFGHKNFYVITRYNRSRLYALAVYFLAEKIKEVKTKR